jgi:predicted AAA+ superfamily ATPase
MDTGLAASVSFRFSSDKGRMLENLVFIELIRRKQEIYFHKKKKECDFIIKQEFEIIQAIQVTLTLQDPDTKQREMAGLLEAMTVSGLKEGWILTDNEEGEETIIEDGITYQIIILPVWKWLLDSVKSQPSQNHL